MFPAHPDFPHHGMVIMGGDLNMYNNVKNTQRRKRERKKRHAVKEGRVKEMNIKYTRKKVFNLENMSVSAALKFVGH